MLNIGYICPCFLSLQKLLLSKTNQFYKEIFYWLNLMNQ